MIPRLFKSDATTFDTLGLGAVTRTISCNVIEELNGAYELNMTMLVDDPLFEFIQIGNIIVAQPNMMGSPQAFVIESVSKVINGEVTVYATHISQYRTKLIPVKAFATSTIAAVINALNTSSTYAEACPFTFSTDMTSSAGLAMVFPKSLRDLMGGTEGSILDNFGGEWQFDNFNIALLKRRGRETDARVMYGRNMTGFTQEETFGWDNSTTGVLPYWCSDKGIANVVGDVQYSQYADLFPYKKTVTVDFTDKFQEMPTKADLESYASQWINSKGLPAVTLECSFDQFDMTDAQVNTLQLGDSVQVINSMYNVNYSSRIVAMDFDVLAETYNNITVGDLKATLGQTISGMVETERVAGNSIYYGTCSTAAATAAKTATILGFPETITTGTMIAIKFTYANGKASPTLSINGGTAHDIRRYGTTYPSTSAASSWNAGSVVIMIYDGDDWQMVNWLNTTYSAISQANIETLAGTSNGLINGQRFTQGFDKRFKSADAYGICYANTIVRTFASGQVTIPLTDIGITNATKPKGILLTPQYRTDVNMKYNYDSSDSSNVIIECWKEGVAYDGDMRFFMVVFQNSW